MDHLQSSSHSVTPKDVVSLGKYRTAKMGKAGLGILVLNESRDSWMDAFDHLPACTRYLTFTVPSLDFFFVFLA
jgi:hypothetical protein